MAFPKDFTTLIRECGLRPDCESCYWLAGTGCPKQERPDKAPVDKDGICADWLDAETRKSVDGKRQSCRKCGKVRHFTNLRDGLCRACGGWKRERSDRKQKPRPGRKNAYTASYFLSKIDTYLVNSAQVAKPADQPKEVEKHIPGSRVPQEVSMSRDREEWCKAQIEAGNVLPGEEYWQSMMRLRKEWRLQHAQATAA